MPWSVAYQAVLTGEGVGMNLTAAGWLTLIQFLVVFCTHSHPPQLCHSPEVKKVTYFYCWEASVIWLQLQMPCPLAKRSLQAHTSPPRMLLTTDALFENQMWKRLVGARASSALDIWMGTKGQNCVSAFQTQLNLATQHAPDHQNQVEVYESKGKRTFESHTRTEDSEINASGTGESSDTCSIYLKYRQSYVKEQTLGTREKEPS